MSILNHYQITDQIASSGQPLENQFTEIAEGGYNAVLNLAMPDHDNSIANEGSVVTALGMTYIHIPVPFDAPADEHFSEFSGYMDVLKARKIWVHCIINARVFAFLFRYMQESYNFSAAEAATPTALPFPAWPSLQPRGSDWWVRTA